MKKLVSVFICIGVMNGLVACNLPGPLQATSPVGPEITEQRQTVFVLLTETAQPITPMPTDSTTKLSPTAQASQPVQETQAVDITAAPQATPLPDPTVTPTSSEPCDQVQPGRPIDITIPDNSEFSPGQYFSKTWRLVNTGSCTWTNAYTITWFSGDLMGANQQQPLSEEVSPGQTIDITVDMVAPMEPGSYQSNWKLQNQQGELFGIGPNGNSPFWVRIVVIPKSTATPSSSEPTATSIPIVYSRGTVSLDRGMAVELDGGTINQDEQGDLVVKLSGENLPSLVTLNEAQLAYFGVTAPDLNACLHAPMGSATFRMDQFQPGYQYCYRTNRGLVGALMVTGVNATEGQINFDFITWVVP